MRAAQQAKAGFAFLRYWRCSHAAPWRKLAEGAFVLASPALNFVSSRRSLCRLSGASPARAKRGALFAPLFWVLKTSPPADLAGRRSASTVGSAKKQRCAVDAIGVLVYCTHTISAFCRVVMSQRPTVVWGASRRVGFRSVHHELARTLLSRLEVTRTACAVELCPRPTTVGSSVNSTSLS